MTSEDEMVTVPVRSDGKRGAEFTCYVDGNGFVQQAVISATLRNAFMADGEPGEPKGSESEKYRVEIRPKKNGKFTVIVTAKKTGMEQLVISSPDCQDTKKIILNAFDEN